MKKKSQRVSKLLRGTIRIDSYWVHFPVQHCSIPHDRLIYEPSSGGIIKVIQLINILTTWARWLEGQREEEERC